MIFTISVGKIFKFATSGVQLKSFMIFQEIFGSDQHQQISVMTEASLNHVLACLTHNRVKIFGDFFYFFTVVELAPNSLLQVIDRIFWVGMLTKILLQNLCQCIMVCGWKCT